ncbi:MAG: glycosyl hydrolase [Sulfurovum sp. 39-42-12]|jgi:exo-beta-1,3-glucanase (GH17 family)|nr:MAG: glycosyl hydrolase [Sulfurovum sp. 35-42-20]OYZ26664.1 MAG: glycosyl hydrolase [Sulfurovum sp. 16-42-52]OYZ48590.1 MAG: glycosyl hydrolase [Sulfurovum sp. 24-42-9]OZA47052.1 MAG: glycosyl hydrolase [Sulfurovum sp. 17-42-90]OZA60119.1 MAG: glycosyl hydrolase [Sulfurovum sp. 39-42-12]
MMRKKLLAILAGLGVIVLFWYLLGEVFVLRDSAKPVTKLQCISYAPFSKEQSPFDFDDGMVISEQQIKKDLALLSVYTDCIRTYSTVGLEAIPQIARDLGMQMYMGAWVSSDEVTTEREIATLIKLAGKYPDVVRAVIVGNEVLLRGDTSDVQLTDYIQKVKQALPNVPVTYADVWEFWLKYPKVAQATDFVTIHILPYWEDDPMNIEHAIAHLEEVREEVQKTLGKSDILIGETGWPSEGRMREDALPSKINQALFIREFVKLAEQKGWRYNLIEAFDQPWKRVNEGAVGGFWGLFDADRNDKKVLYGDVSNFPHYQSLAWGSVLLFLAFAFLLKNAALQTRSIVFFTSLNALFAILFMMQMEQYSVTTRSNFELLWAVCVSLVHLLIYYLLLVFIANGTKPQSISLDALFLKKILTPDVLLQLLFVFSFVLVVISNLALAFEGRYRNFEIYIFMISLISFGYLYGKNLQMFALGRFAKVSFVLLVLTSLALVFNEGWLNLFSDVWVVIALGYAYLLYRGTQEVAYSDLKSIVVYLAGFFALFAALRFGILSNKALILACQMQEATWVCEIKSALGLAAYHDVFGTLAIFTALFALVKKQKFTSLLALFFSVGALMLFNTLLGSIAFVVSLFLLTKDEASFTR